MKKAVILTVTLAAAMAAQAADKITYDDHVLPIFRNACLNCHNPDKKKAGLDLSTYQGALQGSENGKVLQSGNAGGSLLFKCVKGMEDPKMPPKGDMLSDAELSVVEKWIAGQLLENATGKAIAAVKNNVEVAVVSLERPAGPPPMPGDLPLDPYVQTRTTNALTALAVSPWAPLVAIGGQKQVLLYNTETLQPLGVLPFPEGLPTILKFSRNGQILLTGGGFGGKSGKVVLWDIRTGERIATIGNEFDQVLAADLSADQQFVALGGPTKLLKIYATKDGKLLHSIKKHTDWITAMAFSPDGKYLATADRSGGLYVWEGATGKEFNTLPGHKAMITGVAFMPGVLASSSEDGKIALWDAKEGKAIREWKAHNDGVAWVDFTPDGRLVSCGRDKIAKVWDQNGKEIGKTTPMNDIALRAGLSNDRLIVGDWTGEIRVSALDGKVLGGLTANPPKLVDRIAATAKQLADAQAALPLVQQQFAAAEAKLRAEKLVADQKRKEVLEAAEAKRVAAQKALDDQKASVPQAEKHVAEIKGQLPALQKTLDEAQAAAETAQKTVTEKQAAKAPEPEIETAKGEVTARNATRAEAQKQFDARKAQLAQAEAELNKRRGSQGARVAAADKGLQQATAALAELKKAAPAVPAVTAAEQELAKGKAALDETTAQIAAAKADAERWKVAQVLQVAHDARRTLTQKQSQYDQYVAAAKAAPEMIENARTNLATAEKTVTEGPARVKEKEAAFANARQVVEAAKKTLADVEAAIPVKEKAAQAAAENAPPVGDVAGIKKKLDEQNAEITKMRADRDALAKDSPEVAEANKKIEALKVEIPKTEKALAGASVKNLEAPVVKDAQAAVVKAKEAIDPAKLALKNAVQEAAAVEKALAQTKKSIEAAAQLAARLQKELPGIAENSERQKAQAEQAAAAAAKEVEAAKQEAEKRRAEFDTLKAGGAKAANLAVPPSKS